MKILKLKRVMLFLCCFILSAAMLPQGKQAIMTQAVENSNGENTMKISKQIDLPAGVEILKTLVHDDVIYAVGISSSKEAPYNLNGSETDAKIFVAKYNKDLKVESVVDTGYMFSFYSAELYHDDENQKTVTDKNEVGRPQYEMYFADGKLTLVGTASNPNKSKYSATADRIIEHHVKMVVAMQYDTSLKQLQKTDFGFSNYTYGVSCTSVINDGYLYILYIPQMAGKFFTSPNNPNDIVRYDLADFKQKKTANLIENREKEKKYVTYKTMVRYKDGIAVERNKNSLSTDGVNEWDYFSKDLKDMGKINEGQGVTFKNHFANDESYPDNEVNPSFKTNTGGLYRFSRFSLWWSKYAGVSGSGGQGTVDAAQDEKGQIVTLSIDSSLKPTIALRGASGEMTEKYFSFEQVSKKSTNMNVSTAESKIIAVIFQKLYLFEIDAKTKVEKAGEFNNACYNDVITGKGEVNYYDAASNSCYSSKVNSVSSDSYSVKSAILKNGKDFIDFKTSQYIKQTGVFLEVKSMVMNQDGNLVVSGHKNVYPTDAKGTPYAAIIDQNGKIVKEVLGEELFLEDVDSLRIIPKYVNVKMVGQNYVFTGKQEVYFMGSSRTGEENSYTLPFVQVRNKDLKDVKVIFNQNIAKYKNFEVESITSIGQQYMKISLRNRKTQAVQTALYSFKENKIVNVVENTSTQEVTSGDKTISIVDNQIVEKDVEGKEISKQPLKLENAQITPVKPNDRYVVSTVNDKNKLEFHLIGKDGESLQTVATEFEISKDQIVLYVSDAVQSASKIVFAIVDKNGNGSQYEADITSLKAKSENAADEKIKTPFIITGILAAITAVVVSIALVIRGRKKKKQIALEKQQAANYTNNSHQ